MMTSERFLKQCEKAGSVTTFFRFPYIHLVVQNNRFAGLADSEKEQLFASEVGLSIGEIRSVSNRGMFTLHFLSDEDANGKFNGSDKDNRGFHWLRELTNGHAPIRPVQTTARHPSVVHFYGYKGGQARSTLLGLCSLNLADEGWRVLTIDADIEAPSLDILFGRTVYSARGTLLGMQDMKESPTPERVYSAPSGDGFVDLIAYRPRSTEFDLDAVAFALRSSLDPTLIEGIANQAHEIAKDQYDVIMLDHRSGLSITTPAWLHTLPGPTVVCARLDDQWRGAKTFIEMIFRTNLDSPGLFVSWKHDDEPEESYRRRNNAQIDDLLETLASAVRAGSVGVQELSSVELTDHLLVWPYDDGFRLSRLPTPDQLSKLTVERVGELRGLLGLIGPKGKLAKDELSPSGARDEGDLIETDAFRQLVAPRNGLFSGTSISYVFGRKGTGKTRLLRELVKLGLGEPLLVAADSQEGLGLKSNGPEFAQAVAKFRSVPDQLWWQLFRAATTVGSTTEAELRNEFVRTLDLPPLSTADQLSLLAKAGKSRVFLLDGLETAFSGQEVFGFIEGLFRFLLSIENDSRFSQYVQFKLFLRSDLAERGYQNVEQQVSGRAIRLSWNTTKIFNFLLSRIPKKPWFCNTFGELVEHIRERQERILKGQLDLEECETLLLMAFPDSLRRNNLSTMTFLRTYFADSATDTRDRLTYYPRIFDAFLDVIDRGQTAEGSRYSGEQLEDGKISQGLIIFAHEEAAAQYLKQLLSELNYLVSVGDDAATNESNIQALLNAFAGLSTPFSVDERVNELASRASLSPSSVRSAMERMKRLGMFEDRPGYPGQWRVGRLFKSSLNMKYVR